MFRHLSVLIIASAFISISSCSPMNSSTSIGTTPTENEHKLIIPIAPTTSLTTPSPVALPTLDPYCDYPPGLGWRAIMQHVSGPDNATGQTDQLEISVSSLYSTHNNNETSAFLNVVLSGDCRVNSLLIPLGIGTQIEWISIDNGIIIVDILSLGSTDQECCPTVQATKRYNTVGRVVVEEGVTPIPVLSGNNSHAMQIGPDDIRFDTNRLYSVWDANSIDSTSVSLELPDFIHIAFDGKPVSEFSPQYPIGFIIPLDEYLSQSSSEASYAAKAVQDIYNLVIEMPIPPPNSDLPALPHGWIDTKHNNLVVGVSNELNVKPNKYFGNFTTGIRYIGYYNDLNSLITNDHWYYIYQGFSDDGKYLFFFYHPVSSVYLADLEWNSISDGSIPDQNAEIIEFLTSQQHMAFFWRPSLKDLDSVVASLTVDGLQEDPLQGSLWYIKGGEGTVFAPTGELCTGRTNEADRWLKTACDLSTIFDGTETFSIEFTTEGVFRVSALYSHKSSGFLIEKGGLVGKFGFWFHSLWASREIDIPDHLFRHLIGCLSGEYRFNPLVNDLELDLRRGCTDGPAYLLFSKTPIPNRPAP